MISPSKQFSKQEGKTYMFKAVRYNVQCFPVALGNFHKKISFIQKSICQSTLMIFLYVYWHGDFDTMQLWFYKVVFFLVNKKYYILNQVNRLNLFIGFFWTSTIYCITSEKPKKHLWAISRVKGMEIFFFINFPSTLGHMRY